MRHKMLNTAEQIYQFLNSKLEYNLKSKLPMIDAGETSDEYVKRLSLIDAFKPYIVLQSELQNLIPLDPEKKQYVKDLYSFLNSKADLKGLLPAPLPNETYAEYSAKLEGIEELKKAEYQPLETLIHQTPYLKDRKQWKNRKNEIKKFSDKMQSGNVLLIQDREGAFYGKLLQEQIIEGSKGTSYEIYKKSQDVNLAIILGKIIEESLDKFVKNDNIHIRKEITALMIKQIPLLHSNPTIFYDGLMTAFKSSHFLNESNLNLEDNTENDKILQKLSSQIASKFYRHGYKQIRQMDNEFLARWLPEAFREKRNGITINKATDSTEQLGVLITTSDGGGCHKNIANNTASTLKKEGIDSAVINESVLTQIDPLQQVIGIPRSDLYPVIRQQFGEKDCCNLLKKIDDQIRLNFIAPYEFSQLRDATDYCEQHMQIGTVFSTQHYADNLRIVPTNANIVFQVCDYGHCGKLEELVQLVSNVYGNSADDYNVKFLIPSTTCLSAINQLPENASDFFVTGIYPTKILSNAETQFHFNNLIAKQDLFPSDEKNVYRCAIVMGGQGCGELIEKYIDKIANELSNLNSNEKLEVIVVCGNNEPLQKGLIKKYQDIITQSPNIKIKFCGRIDNAELIAYNKNAVLITKPGGGTIAECIENQIQTLVHYDHDLPWERGNADEIVIQELGEILAGTPVIGEPPVEVHDLDLLSKIKDALAKRKERLEIHEKYEQTFEEEIATLRSDFTIKQQAKVEKLQQEKLGSIECFYDGNSKYESIIEHMDNTICKLKRLEGKHPKNAEALREIHDLEIIHKSYTNLFGEKNANKHLNQLDAFVDKYSKTSSEVFVTNQIKQRVVN